MNETIRNILNRRSTRAFSDRQVAKEDVELIVKCGTCAANGMDLQPWHFTVIQSREMLAKISAEYRKYLADPKKGAGHRGAGDPEYDCIYGAPTLIIVSGETDGTIVAVDCGNAVENMAVAATSLGLGSCFIASVSVVFEGSGASLKEELGIPEDFVPMFSLALGYADELPPEREERRKDAVNFVW